MKNISIWKESNIKDYPKLEKNLDLDVLIIGGGITGISTYYHLKKSNLKIALVEQNKIGFSVTGNSTGKLSYLQNDLIDNIRSNFNDKLAYNYIESQISSIKMVTDIISKEKIDCDLQKVDSILYTNKKSEVNKVKKLKDFLKKYNINVTETNCNLVKNKYMIKVDNTYIFNPIKYLNGLVDDNSFIFEQTSIKRIEKSNKGYICYTDKNTIKTKWVVLALHYPYFLIPYLFPIKGSLEKSYISASKWKGERLSLISYSNPFISIRSYNDYLIYLSNSHNITSDVNDSNNFNELNKKISDLNLKPEYMWSNIDIITNDGLPYIGKIKNKMLIGTGYNTWGLTNGSLAGKILSDIILGNSNKYINLFNPNRFNLSLISGAVMDTFYNINGFIKGYFDNNNKLKYYKKNGKELIQYENNIVFRKCPHLGCKLIFNDKEKTWDCPCHGSRFDIKGKCISGPANKDISKS